MPYDHNWVDGFRYSEEYEDVFVEDDHFLYACAEPLGWAHIMACRVYTEDGGKLVRSNDTTGHDADYLLSLERADETTARSICRMEELHALGEVSL